MFIYFKNPTCTYNCIGEKIINFELCPLHAYDE